MLSQPNAGYTSITINNVYVGTASYADDVPVILMEYFTDILQHDNDDLGHEVSNTPLMNERKRALESMVANLESLL